MGLESTQCRAVRPSGCPAGRQGGSDKVTRTRFTTGGRLSATQIEQHRMILRKIGPMPRRALAALHEYGLEDEEIARYLGMTCASLRRLERTLGLSHGVPPGRD